MRDAIEETVEFVLIEEIAAGLRAEFLVGVAMEEQPGLRDPAEAGQVNRAFRVVARTVLRSLAVRDVDLAALLNQVCTRLVRRRLLQEGLVPRQIDDLLNQEPGREDWLIFFLLTPREEIAHQLDERDSENGSAPPHSSVE